MQYWFSKKLYLQKYHINSYCSLLGFFKRMKEKKEMCKNYYKGESGETKFSVVILVLILVSSFFNMI